MKIQLRDLSFLRCVSLLRTCSWSHPPTFSSVTSLILAGVCCIWYCNSGLVYNYLCTHCSMPVVAVLVILTCTCIIICCKLRAPTFTEYDRLAEPHVGKITNPYVTGPGQTPHASLSLSGGRYVCMYVLHPNCNEIFCFCT